MADPVQLRLPLGDRPRLKPGAVGGCASGGTTHDLYKVWVSMIRRCENSEQADFDRYGAKGVRVCDRWRYSFADFCEDMGPRPDGFTIDRIDPAKGYDPGNCRWLSRSHNAARVFQSFDGRKSLNEYSRALGGNRFLCSGRLTAGWCHQCATTVPKGAKRPVCSECNPGKAVRK